MSAFTHTESNGFITVRNVTRDRLLGNRIRVADRFWPRLKGLLGKKGLDSGEGLLLSPCRSVHTLGMSFPIDVLLVDSKLKIVALYPELGNRARTRWHRNAAHVLELPAGSIEATGSCIDDQLADTPPHEAIER